MSGGFCEPVSNRADVGRVATAASSDVSDPFSTRAFAELNKFGSRELDRFQFVRELWKARERLALRSRAKRTGLCRNRHLGGIAHFAQQRQHYLRSLLAIGAHRNRTEIGHDLGTLAWRVTITAGAYERAKTHRGDRRQATGNGAFERHLHFGQMKKSFKDQKIHPGIFEEPNLLGDMIARASKRFHALALDQLRARNTACDQCTVAGHFSRQFNRRGVDGFGLRAVTGSGKLLTRAKKRECLQNLRTGTQKFAV